MNVGLLAWRQLGDLVSASTAMGLHREADSDRPVTFVSELRRRLFVIVFSIDKSSSLLTGRPPALAYRYCQFKLPLDLSDEAVMDSKEFVKAIEKLDENGWNTDGQIYHGTMARASGCLAIVLNEILELALGNEEFSNAQLRYIVSPPSRL
jgi:hypothetical protein